MLNAIRIVLLVVLIFHGLIHLMGLVAYFPLREVSEIPYKTAFLGGRLDFGTTGTRIFSLLWLLAAAGLVAAGVALLAGWSWGIPLLVAAAALSLLITVLDWSVAFRGAFVDVAIFVVILVGPWLASLVNRGGSVT
jgi:hypothetical protein